MKELKEAKAWLYGAQTVFDADLDVPEKFTVVVAMCIHAIIRANDGLTVKFLKKKSFRHEDAPELFLQLIEHGIINKKYENLQKEILLPAVEIKSMVDYRGTIITKTKANTWIEKTKRFIEFANESLK